MGFKPKEVSYAILAATGIGNSSNYSGQLCGWFDLAKTIQLQLAELPWRSDRRTDGVARLGVVKAGGCEKVMLRNLTRPDYACIFLKFWRRSRPYPIGIASHGNMLIIF